MCPLVCNRAAVWYTQGCCFWGNIFFYLLYQLVIACVRSLRSPNVDHILVVKDGDVHLFCWITVHISSVITFVLFVSSDHECSQSQRKREGKREMTSAPLQPHLSRQKPPQIVSTGKCLQEHWGAKTCKQPPKEVLSDQAQSHKLQFYGLLVSFDLNKSGWVLLNACMFGMDRQ